MATRRCARSYIVMCDAGYFSPMVLHALLVEDNKVIRDNLIPMLEALSEARVEGTAETEADAIAWFESHDGWDVAVVDLFLREGSVLISMES